MTIMGMRSVLFRAVVLLTGFVVSFFIGRLTNYASRWQAPTPVGRWGGSSLPVELRAVDLRRSAHDLLRETALLDATEQARLRDRDYVPLSYLDNHPGEQLVIDNPSSDRHASGNDSNREGPVDEGDGGHTQSGNMSSSSSVNGPWSSMDRVKYVLKRSVKHVEDEVLDFNVGDTLKGMSDDSLRDSRLAQKLHRALTSPDEKCVIRIVKYCSNRCAHFLIGNHDQESLMQWKRFACPSITSPCVVETRFASNMSESVMGQTDILIIVPSLHDGLQLDDLMARRPPGQLWMLFSRESPQHDPEYAPPHGTENPYNLTMSVFHDSDLHFPYCYTEARRGRVPDLPSNKTKLIIWMASNCRLLSWTRGAMVNELQKYLPIDTYGKCGDLGHLDDALVDITLGQYKFYLAFENSECRDYITEKAWRKGLERGLVPIVYGSHREDYERALPPNSFIYLQDFTSMRDFADHMRALDVDDARYRKFFDWRADTQINCPSARSFVMANEEINMCFLLRKITHIHAHPETSWRRKVLDFKTWWEGKCSDVRTKQDVLGIDVHARAILKPMNTTKR